MKRPVLITVAALAALAGCGAGNTSSSNSSTPSVTAEATAPDASSSTPSTTPSPAQNAPAGSVHLLKTVHAKSKAGYTFDVTWDFVVRSEVTQDSANAKPGQTISIWTPHTDGGFRITNTTPGGRNMPLSDWAACAWNQGWCPHLSAWYPENSPACKTKVLDQRGETVKMSNVPMNGYQPKTPHCEFVFGQAGQGWGNISLAPGQSVEAQWYDTPVTKATLLHEGDFSALKHALENISPVLTITRESYDDNKTEYTPNCDETYTPDVFYLSDQAKMKCP